MHVVVVGCGRVGSELTIALEEGGHSVAVIDKAANSFSRLPPGFAGRTVEAGIEEAGAVAAVTNGDNSNILVARVAHETFGIERVVARIYDPRRATIYQRLGIPTVATVAWTTDQVLRRLLPDDEARDWIDAGGRVCLVERPLPATWAGKKLGGLNEPGAFVVSAMMRLGTARVATPDVVGQEGDLLYFMAEVSALDTLRERLDGGPR